MALGGLLRSLLMRLQSAGWQLRLMLSQRSTAWSALARRLCSERSAAA
eukprot:COSAG04_NODE_10512_length_772_cov_0.557207_3_plen_47_part_01